jgi:proline iminopeptidase
MTHHRCCSTAAAPRLLAALLAASCSPAAEQATLPADPVPVTSDALMPINGTELYVKRIGSGEPVVVVHGGPVLEHGYLLPHLQPLADDYEVIFYDQRLSGRSAGTTPPETVRAATFVADIEALRVALNLGPIHLMGHSWGGYLAMQYAIEHGANLRSLILLDSMAASAQLWQEEEAELAQTLPPETQAELDALRATDAFKQRRPEAIAAMLTLAFRPQFTDADRLAELHLYVPTDYVARSTQFGAMMVDLESFDFHDALAGVTTPTLVLYGANEPGAALGGAAIAAALPDATTVLIPDSGHFPFIENRGAFLDAVRTFLAR